MVGGKEGEGRVGKLLKKDVTIGKCDASQALSVKAQ
jgi:hypothetical protein